MQALHFRLSEFIADARQQAASMPAGPERDKLLEKIREADADAKIEAWANSPGLQPTDIIASSQPRRRK